MDKSKYILIKILFLLLIATGSPYTQDIIRNEIQVNFNTYTDNFRVAVFYPSILAKKKISPSTGITGKYLVDAISAASMRSHFEVDGVSSATTRLTGGRDDVPDELRHELGAGIVQKVADVTFNVNGLYSTEHDYSSKTLIGNVALPFAQKNTTLQIEVTRSWDEIFPQTRDWTKTKKVLSIDASISQIVSKKAIAQFMGFYSHNKGLLSNPYDVIQFIEGNTLHSVESVHPSTRSRRAIGTRGIVMPGEKTSIEAGYRFYWDSWEVQSHTLHLISKRYIGSRNIRMSAGGRLYIQEHAYFFQNDYDGSEEFMTVDSKLDNSFSQEYDIRITFLGQLFKDVSVLGFFNNNSSDISLSAKLYHRHTETRNWHNRRKDLLALLLGIGVKYGF